MFGAQRLEYKFLLEEIYLGTWELKKKCQSEEKNHVN